MAAPGARGNIGADTHFSEASVSAQDQSQTAFDVIVVGSGAGAMTAAITASDQGLSVLVVEKSDKFGGTSAITGSISTNCTQFGIGYSINIVEANTGIVTMADTISRVTNARISRDAEESSEESA